MKREELHALARGPEWLDLVRDGDGRIICNLKSAMTALREDPNLRDCFGFDEMSGDTALMNPLPDSNRAPQDRPVTDVDILVVQEYLQTCGLKRISKDVVHDAVDRRARECAFHPIRDWLQSLTWDGKRRLAGWLHNILGADDSAYAAGIGKMFMISMVARVMDPGCQADHMVILESPGQGQLKSTACRILAGDAYFADELPVASKDVSMIMKGRWLIEVSELHAFSVKDIEHLKALITRRVEVYRPPYGRKTVKEPRQCLLIGTTNRTEYLVDPTGNRRFWPIRIGNIDIDRLKRERDQLFAEAYHLYKDGAPWWPDEDFTAAHIETQQENRRAVDVWEADVLKYIEGKDTVRLQDILLDALDIQKDRREFKHSNRVRNILTANGWWRGHKDSHGYYPYHPPHLKPGEC